MKKSIGRIFLVLLLGILHNVSTAFGNDSRSNPTPLIGSSVDIIASNIGATKEPGEEAHGGNQGGASVWFVWTNTFGNNTPVLISTEGSTFDTTMSVFLWAGNNQFQLLSADDNFGFAAGAQFTTINFGNPNVYLIAVDGYNGGSGAAQGQIQLSLKVLPIVTITAPVNGANFPEGTNITLTATVNPRAGRTVERVEFLTYNFDTGQQTTIGTDTNAPYSFVWQAPPAGQYYLFAMVMDSASVSNYSQQEVIINVNSASQSQVDVLPIGSTWKYLHGPTAAPANWKEDDFIDTSWLTGPGPLGNQTDRGAFIRTVFSNYNPAYITTYFRKIVNVTNAASFSELVLNYNRDDSLAIYINNQEVFRDNLPGGDLNYNTSASGAIPNDQEDVYLQATIPNALVNGDNIIAVEVHQSGSSSSDVGFDLGIVGRISAGVRLTQPSSGMRYLKGTNISLEASATPLSGTITQVIFYAGTTLLGADATSPYSFAWLNVPAGEFQLKAVARENNGINHTSTVVMVSVEDPQANVAPRIVGVVPAPGPATNFSTFTLQFSEQVVGIDPSMILINGSPAIKAAYLNTTNVSFSFPTPSPGAVTVELSQNHNFTDTALQPLRLDTSTSGRTWNYTVRDGIPPAVASVTPAPGSTVGTLSSITVTFSKNVQGVNASDLLINGAPASTVNGTGSTYTFGFLQPALGAVNVSFASNHGITDLSDPPNAFNASAPAASWQYSLEAARTFLIQTNSAWSFRKGTNEASLPISAWRMAGFEQDNSWEEAEGGFSFGDPWPNGTRLTDMQGSYTTIFLRQPFFVSNPTALENVRIRAVADDAFIAWVNGVEVARFNIGVTDPTYDASAPSAANEPVSYQTYNVTDTSMFVSGNNMFAVQVFNAGLGSSDLIFDIEMSASIADPSTVPPTLVSVLPAVGDVSTLTSVTVRFSEPVQGVNGSDLLVNNIPATGVTGSGDTYTFTFPQPTHGNVSVRFASNHGIVDLDTTPKPFDATTATWSYFLINPNAPVISSVVPGANSIVANLTQVQVTFNKTVTGVNASDFLVNGVAATNVTGSGNTYTFRFPEPAPGTINFSWAANHGIQDTAATPNAFDAVRGTALWQITLRDEVAPVIVSQVPAAGSLISNLTSITVNFSEPVLGVNASDLIINGRASTRVVGNGSTYVFEFPQPSASTITVTWSANHGITDAATPANPFNANAPGASWTYQLSDNLVPVIAAVVPGVGSTVAELTRLEVVFSEPVGGLQAADLLVNGTPASSLQGAGAGPYAFGFPQPANGTVTFSWAANHGIHDFASPSNLFSGQAFTITLRTNMVAPQIVINEIMFNPSSVNRLEEYIEFRNNGTEAVNMAGWQITRGVSFLFPAVIVQPGGYIVVAANTNAFRTKYPTVNNVVGNWAGSLSNSREDIELSDPYGDRVDIVNYADEGDWAVRERVNDPRGTGAQGWSWFSAADGPGNGRGGRSMELRNPVLENENGQNWLPSANANGTPGVVNSSYTNNIAPLILDTIHTPPVPRSTDFVYVTARIIDETSNPVVNLRWRNATTANPGNFQTLGMSDSGVAGDAVAGDGTYTGVVSPQSSGTVIEFYVEARDSANNTNTWPAAARMMDNSFSQAANASFQFWDDETYSGTQPIHRMIFTEADRTALINMPNESNAEVNGTFITVDGTGVNIRYNMGVRIRGAGSRGAAVNNYRVNIPTDRLWKGVNELNQNVQYAHSQVAGAALTQNAGAPTADARFIQVRINGANLARINEENAYGSWALVEVVNGDWADNHFPEDPNGNTYSARRPNTDLSYLGTNPQSYINQGYGKTSNQSENDWSDLINLTDMLNNAPDGTYIAAVRELVNVEEWLKFFAVGTLLGYSETALNQGTGDDYNMYRPILDPRMMLVLHDLDTVLGLGQGGAQGVSQSIWAGTSVNAIRRFLRHPEITPLYYEELMRQVQTAFAPSNVNALLDQTMTGHIPSGVIQSMKTFNSNRIANVLSQIPQTLTINHTLQMANGFPTATTSTISLNGSAPAVGTRAVLVKGVAATYNGWQTPNTWSATGVALSPGLNRIKVQAVDGNGGVIAESILEVYYNDNDSVTLSGTLATNRTLTASGGPYVVSGNLTVASGATLTIMPGTTLLLGNSVSIIVANGGRLLAEGTPSAPIVFTRGPSGITAWGGIIINGSVGSPETRIAHAHIVNNGSAAITSTGGTIYLDSLTFGTTSQRYLNVDNSSFIVSNCTFPATTGSIEGVHGSGGIKTGGVGIFRRNYFGAHTGYNDNNDFTGGNRPEPIVHFINNVFFGSGDDLLDLDGTDAWVEGNIFLRAHQNGSPDSASAISGGRDGTATSELTIIGNIFYDLDHAVLAKEGNFYTLLNNTIVRQTRQGGTDTDAAVIILADEGTAEGLGVYLEGNILHDIEKLTRHTVSSTVTFTNNLMPLPWSGPGGGNSTENPGLRYVPQVSETTFTTWQQAQVLWDWFSLTEGSPARGTGPNGSDKGAVNPRGVSIAGEPATITSATSATLTVGPNRTGNGIPASALPSGAGYIAYKWRLNGGAWSAEMPINNPIVLNNLTNGTYVVEAVGRLDSGLWQDNPVFGDDAAISVSRSWIVNTQAITVVINEVLARNSSAVSVGGQFPDLMELHNPGSAPVNIGGLRLTDDITQPNKFVFPAGTTIPAGGYIIIYGDDEVTPLGHHLGFGFGAEGESIYLLAPASDGRVLDQVHFGQQLQNFSVGRLPNGEWSLTHPTFGAVNRAATTGVGNRVVINEWLAASGTIPFDFIELYNQEELPINIGGYHLSDEPIGAPWQHRIAPLTFVPAGGFLVFIADGRPADGPNHLNFSLASEQGAISLANREVQIIDILHYGPQRLNVSQGRQPNGGINLVYFDQPTPGSPNPAAVIPGGSITINEVFANNGSTNISDYVELYNPSGVTVSLAGYSLTDDTLNSRKYVFPAGVTIPALGHLVVYFDNGSPASATNTGFNISANGAGIYLFDTAANGGGLLNSVVFGLQAPAFSIGRVPNGTGQFVLNLPTPNSANIAVSLAGPSSIKINEWVADPAAGEDDWIELYNTAAQPVALGGMYISDNLSTVDSRKKHRFADLSFIGGNEFLVLTADNNPAGGGDHVAFALSAGGESIGISDTNAVLLESITFGQQIEGVSQGRLPDAGTNIVSFGPTQSPGESNYLPISSVVINEVLANSDAPYEDAIELYNTTGAPINIGGWFLSDAGSNLRKFQIPAGTTIPAFGYVVFYENQFNAVPDAPNNFALSSAEGDNVVLSQAVGGNLTGYREEVRFGPSATSISFGRYRTSVGVDFTALSQPTFGRVNPPNVTDFRLGTGATNAYPLVGPIVISQIMYRPPDSPLGVDNVLMEYLQLHNVSGSTVQLYDTSRPTNTWRLRDAVDFEFPTGVSLAPGEQILVVSFDPANAVAMNSFRTNYNIGSSVRIFGPYRGTLDNGNGTIELERPDIVQPDGSVPYIVVERIRYSDRFPWPSTPDGRGDALVRISSTQYGSDPANWVAAAPNPGPAEQDTDSDGMPDDWEVANGLNPNNPSDADGDLDSDGMSNLNEFRAGTDPRSAASSLRLTSAVQVQPGSPGIEFNFTAMPNKSYSVQYRTAIGEPWQNLINVPPGVMREVEVTDTPTDRMRFYRIVTPAQP